MRDSFPLTCFICDFLRLPSACIGWADFFVSAELVSTARMLDFPRWMSCPGVIGCGNMPQQQGGGPFMLACERRTDMAASAAAPAGWHNQAHGLLPLCG
eukprot:CAMPEP_0168461568 /NCGR_PEP_ID=MMETSP0228-20121227/54051_1 /TAXON_ID=133427 /ORGANISM="Protoceratium reticulatum, Strain CCCM 535 (=CCMP 1889)" /LENGTH=98 /DNA_ID=CAMNT_0008476885 /DNA_START=8 /DNA_END=300 /DNA_ORIENTATION=-